jgi:hypothetical protein
MPPAEFEPAIPASKRPYTHVLDRVDIGTGTYTLHINTSQNTKFSKKEKYNPLKTFLKKLVYLNCIFGALATWMLYTYMYIYTYMYMYILLVLLATAHTGQRYFPRQEIVLSEERNVLAILLYQ